MAGGRPLVEGRQRGRRKPRAFLASAQLSTIVPLSLDGAS